MSKYLYLIRHAKSSWDDPSLDDFHRPLSSRGERDAPDMGNRLARRNVIPDLMLSSPATRALTTCQIIADKLDYPREAIEKDEDIYMGSSSDLLEVVHQIEDTWRTVLLFGHNPGFTDFANKLNGTSLDNIPTCGIVLCKFNVDRWEEIRYGSGKKVFFDFPKNKS
jgi:phosphohistidine phosphatase